jgi:hypothetical protein
MEKFQIQKYAVHLDVTKSSFLYVSTTQPPQYAHSSHSLQGKACLKVSYVAHGDIWHDKTPFNPFPDKAETKCQSSFEIMSYLFMEILTY